MNDKLAADIAYCREKAAHFRMLAEKAQPMVAERLRKLAADLDAKVNELEKSGHSNPPK